MMVHNHVVIPGVAVMLADNDAARMDPTIACHRMSGKFLFESKHSSAFL
jgi:hypothetical protein